MWIRAGSLLLVSGALGAGAISGALQVERMIYRIPALQIQAEIRILVLIYIGYPLVIILSQIAHTLLVRVWETWLAFLEPSQIDILLPALEEERDFKVAKIKAEREKELAYIEGNGKAKRRKVAK